MKKPNEVIALVGKFGAMVDVDARAFLTRGPYAMYGMMRYFMGYEDEYLRPTTEVFGGKRFRSGLCLMLAEQYGALGKALPVALAIEIFHNFTLIHDDIEDRDELRRGRPTVWKLWGINHGINTGDGQLVLAIQSLERVAPEIRDTVRSFFLSTFLEIVEGQYLDFTLTDYALDDPRTTEKFFLEMLTKKTSVLVAAATKGAGIAAGVSKEEQNNLWKFGLALGLAYQLCDDTISIWGSAEITGKAQYGDVREKKKTIPVLYTIRTLGGGERNEFLRLYEAGGSMSDAGVERAIALMNSVNAYEYARARVDEEATNADQAIQALSIPAVGKETLHALVKALLPRVPPSV